MHTEDMFEHLFYNIGGGDKVYLSYYGWLSELRNTTS